jgi:hypothetical protein
MSKKGLVTWLFSFSTSITLIHLIEAISVLAFDSEIRLLQLYPFINEKLEAITPTTYLWLSAVSAFILWGITCAIAFENPVEAFLNKILSDAKKQNVVETQLLDTQTFAQYVESHCCQNSKSAHTAEKM